MKIRSIPLRPRIDLTTKTVTYQLVKRIKASSWTISDAKLETSYFKVGHDKSGSKDTRMLVTSIKQAKNIKKLNLDCQK